MQDILFDCKFSWFHLQRVLNELEFCLSKEHNFLSLSKNSKIYVILYQQCLKLTIIIIVVQHDTNHLTGCVVSIQCNLKLKNVFSEVYTKQIQRKHLSLIYQYFLMQKKEVDFNQKNVHNINFRIFSYFWKKLYFFNWNI